MDTKPRFVEFKQARTGWKITINPAYVTAISEMDDKGFCSLYLQGYDGEITIVGTYPEVKERCLY